VAAYTFSIADALEFKTGYRDLKQDAFLQKLVPWSDGNPEKAYAYLIEWLKANGDYRLSFITLYYSENGALKTLTDFTLGGISVERAYKPSSKRVVSSSSSSSISKSSKIEPFFSKGGDTHPRGSWIGILDLLNFLGPRGGK